MKLTGTEDLRVQKTIEAIRAVFEQMRWMRQHKCQADLCYFTNG